MTSISLLLKQAAFEGDLTQVRSLIDAGADVNATDQYGAGTLLTFHPAITAYLLSKGAAPNVQVNEFGASVLAGLCYVNQIECVKLLLEHGADPNQGRSASLETPLHHALAGDAGDPLIQLLIKYGANVNARAAAGVLSYNFYGRTPTRGETPLHRAAAYASIEVVERLIQAGADRSSPDVNGNQPHQWAGWHRRSQALVELLRPSTAS